MIYIKILNIVVVYDRISQYVCVYNYTCVLYVSLLPPGHSEWLSLDNHRHRIACLGHKTSPTAAAASSGTTTTSELPAPGNSASSSSSTMPLPAEHVIDPHWLGSLQPGSLLDARDPSRVWYQVSSSSSGSSSGSSTAITVTNYISLLSL